MGAILHVQDNNGFGNLLPQVASWKSLNRPNFHHSQFATHQPHHPRPIARQIQPDRSKASSADIDSEGQPG